MISQEGILGILKTYKIWNSRDSYLEMHGKHNAFFFVEYCVFFDERDIVFVQLTGSFDTILGRHFEVCRMTPFFFHTWMIAGQKTGWLEAFENISLQLLISFCHTVYWARRCGAPFVGGFDIYHPLQKDDEQNFFSVHLQHSPVVDENRGCVHEIRETEYFQIMKPKMSLTDLWLFQSDRVYEQLSFLNGNILVNEYSSFSSWPKYY